MHCPKMYRTRRIAFEFLAQFENVVVNRSCTRVVLVSPYFIEQLVARNHSAGVFDQILESFEFFTCESNGPTVAMNFHRRKTSFHSAKLKRVCGVRTQPSLRFIQR